MYPGTYAKTQPDRAAVIAAESGEVVTWQTLNDRSNQLAQLLWKRGLRPGDNCAIFLENHLRYFEAVWAGMRSGLSVTAINRYLTTEETAYILNDCAAKALITSTRLAEAAATLPTHTPNCGTWLMIDGTTAGFESYEEALEDNPSAPLEHEPMGVFMLYSSGTTGRPKGIKRDPPGVDAGQEGSLTLGPLLEQLWQVGPDTVYLSPAPMYHSAPLGFSTTVQGLGGTVVMMERFDAKASLDFIEQYQITHSQWVPTMFSRMLKLPAADRESQDLSSHRVAIHAAAPCPTPVKQSMMDWWGPILHEYYGGTELNGLTYVGPTDWLERPGTVGRAILGTLHVCDDDGNELAPGETGLVYFEQEEMPFSYHNDPEKTKNAEHPTRPGWSALGDVGYLDQDGFLYLTDRASFMIISGGVNIYPQEIEDALVLHPKVGDVAVFGVPNEDMGEEVKAVVEPAPGVSPDPVLGDELMDYARSRLAAYKCPRSIDFTEELPRLPTGKLYKRLLKDRYWGNKDSRIV